MINKFLGEVKGIFNKITIIGLIISIIYFIVGLIYFSDSSTNSILLSILCGILIIGNGISSIYSYLKRKDIVLFNYNMIYGVIMINCGLLLFLFLSKYLKFILGSYLLICGIQKITYGLFLKKFHESSWTFTAFVGLLFMVIGIITYITNIANITSVTGICLLAYGIMNFISTLLLRKRSSYFIA